MAPSWCRLTPACCRQFGLLAADYLRYDSLTRHLIVEGAVADDVREIFATMKQRAIEAFADLGLTDDLTFTYTLETRFVRPGIRDSGHARCGIVARPGRGHAA